MADDVKIPGIGETSKKPVIYIGSAAGAYVAYRWWKARQSAAAAAAGPAPLPVDTSNTAAAQGGGVGYANPDPNAGPSAFNSGSLTTNANWTSKAEQDLANIGYDAQTVATALGLYLSSQPLTLDQQTIVRVAWAMDGKPPDTPNLPIIPAQNNPNAGGGGTPPPPPPPTPTPTPTPAPQPAPDPHAGQHWQDPQVATLENGRSIRDWQRGHPTNNLATLAALNPRLGVDQRQHPGTTQILTSTGRWVPN